jgi:Ser/Thr protein kinase RdoA (MazF antagonist)
MREAPLDQIADRILKEAANRFGAADGKLTALHDSVKVAQGGRFVEKSLHQCERDGKNYILRLTHPKYVDFKQINGEADWVNCLADNGMAVPRMIPSEDGLLVEIITTRDSAFAAVCFEKVEGRQIRFDDQGEWNAELFQRYGETIGRMHALTKEYEPKDKSLVRIKWHQQDWIAGIDRYLPASESLVRDKHHELVATLHSLPKDRDSYGLIHGDAHPWNMLIDKRELILTDFDFCERSWFASEIAIILFYAVMAPTEEMSQESFGRHFLENFLKGYRRENGINSYWIKQIPNFLRLRMMSKFILHYPEWQASRMSEKRESAFKEWRRKIENDVPYVDIRFSDFG